MVNLKLRYAFSMGTLSVEQENDWVFWVLIVYFCIVFFRHFNRRNFHADLKNAIRFFAVAAS